MNERGAPRKMLLLLALLGASVLINVLQATAGNGTGARQGGSFAFSAPEPAVSGRPPAKARASIALEPIDETTQLVRILDSERSVICYGIIKAAGSASVSCQKAN